MSQDSGWNSEILEWCLLEARERKLKEQDYWGGFVIDEMKIQVLITFIVYSNHINDNINFEFHILSNGFRVALIKLLILLRNYLFPLSFSHKSNYEYPVELICTSISLNLI